MHNNLPWEVQLLLMLEDADPDVCKACIDHLMEDAASGEMPPAEVRRFADAMGRLADEHHRSLVQLRMLVEEPWVKFENGQWRIT